MRSTSRPNHLKKALSSAVAATAFVMCGLPIPNSFAQDIETEVRAAISRDIIQDRICAQMKLAANSVITVTSDGEKCHVNMFGKSGNTIFLGRVSGNESCNSTAPCTVDFLIMCEFRGLINAKNCDDWGGGSGLKRSAKVTFHADGNATADLL